MERMGLLLALASAFSGRSPAGLVTTFTLYQIRHSLNLEGQVLVFISPRYKLAQLYPQTLGSLYVASYDSQCYGGGIRNRIHTGLNCSANFLPEKSSSSRTTQKIWTLYCCKSVFTVPLHSNGRDADYIGNTVLLLSGEYMLRALPNKGRSLPSHCLATGL
jgi:hypothetical protein